MNESKQFPSTVADKFVVRFPDGMRDRIKEAAEANNRSMNAEIVARLQHSFQLPAKIDSIMDDYRVVDAGHDQKDAMLEQITRLYEEMKAVSDQQQHIINHLLKALPDDTPKK